MSIYELPQDVKQPDRAECHVKFRAHAASASSRGRHCGGCPLAPKGYTDGELPTIRTIATKLTDFCSILQALPRSGMLMVIRSCRGMPCARKGGRAWAAGRA